MMGVPRTHFLSKSKFARPYLALDEFQPVHMPLDVCHSNEPSTTPNQSTETHEFTVTHPFHPQYQQTFPILSRRKAWGEPRVQYIDPDTEQVQSLPVAWTDLAATDPFVELGAGRALLPPSELQALSRLLRQLAAADGQ